MDGAFVIAIRVIHHYVALPLHNMYDIRFLRRPHRTLFILLLFAILVVQNPLIGLLSTRDHAGLMLPRGLHAASLQTVAACQELLVNGDLEASDGWLFGATPAPGMVVNAPVHTGAFAIRLGISAGNNTTAYSTAYQTVALPADAEQIVLTYWERPGTTGDSGDYREVIALRPNFSILRVLERQTGAGNDHWAQRTFDLTDLRGQSIVLYFNVYNNGSDALLANHLDDISLQSCDNITPATPTPTPTTSVTPAPPTPTATVTPLPSNIIVRAGSMVLVEGQTAINVPLELIGATAERPVGVLSVDVQYDAAVLNAVACTVGDSFDLLLCNIDTPGVMQLAGIAATGIHTDVRVADLGFELLQPANLPTQLTVQLDTIADTEGSALTAIPQNGQIRAPCPPGSDTCQNLFLPLVYR